MKEHENYIKIREIASEEVSPWLEKAKKRQQNRPWLLKSQAIASKVITALKKKGLQQKDLAMRMGVSQQQISKIVKGTENLTLKTISKLEQELEVKLIEVSGFSVQHEFELSDPIYKEKKGVKKESKKIGKKENISEKAEWRPDKLSEIQDAA